MSVVDTILFLVGYISLAVGIFLLKKNERVQNVLVWIPITFVLVMSYHALIGGILNIFRVPIILRTMGIADFILGCFLCCMCFGKRQIQKYELHKKDLVMGVTIVLTAAYAGYRQFGLYLTVHYLTEPDPAVHMRYAMEVMQNHTLGKMYYAALNNALFMSVFKNLLPMFKMYQVFVFADILMLLLAGFMMYALMERYIKNHYHTVLAMFFTVAYMLGFPWNNMVIGFVYMGMGVTLCGLLLFLAYEVYEQQEVRLFYLFALMIGTTGLGVCYTMFTVPLYVAVACIVCLTIWMKTDLTIGKRLKQIVVTNVSIFLLPCIVTLWYSMFQVAPAKQMSANVTSGISLEGFCYAEPFWDVIWLLPFIVWGVYCMIREKKELALGITLSIYLCYTLALLVARLSGKLSVYYFMKNYYVLALLLFLLAFYGATMMVWKKWIPWLIIGVEAIVTVAGRDAGIKTDSIYQFNNEALEIYNLSNETICLFQDYDRKEFGETNLVFRGNRNDYYWFRAISGVTSTEDVAWWPWWLEGYAEKGSTVVALNYEDHQLDEWIYNIGIENVEILYQGEAGIVVQLKKDWYEAAR